MTISICLSVCRLSHTHVKQYYVVITNPRWQTTANMTRKLCCRKETARCRRCFFSASNLPTAFTKPSFESWASERQTYSIGAFCTSSMRYLVQPRCTGFNVTIVMDVWRRTEHRVQFWLLVNKHRHHEYSWCLCKQNKISYTTSLCLKANFNAKLYK